MMQNDAVIQGRAELDILLANIETAVKVKSRACFFSWVQGVFQGIVPHEGLVCAIPHPATRGLRFDWLGSYPIPEEHFAELSRSDGLFLLRFEIPHARFVDAEWFLVEVVARGGECACAASHANVAELAAAALTFQIVGVAESIENCGMFPNVGKALLT